MSRRVVGVGVAVVVVVGCMAVVWFLLRQHDVERAGAWAGILGLIGLPVAVWGMWLATKPIVRSGPPTPTAQLQQNEASDGGTVYAVQEGNQTVHINAPDAAPERAMTSEDPEASDSSS